jgi:uncharacterized coiled-coil DUF342 family protein
MQEFDVIRKRIDQM